MDYSARLHKVIPGGCHTYSRGDDQFPANAPQLLIDADGPYVYDEQEREFLDYGMGLRSVVCGYAETLIVNAAYAGMLMGNCLTRPSLVELEAAELACDLLGFDMVKFAKNGSTATTAAIKLARAYTGRWDIACANQPFFSYDDWFIGTTTRNRGIRSCSTKIFKDAEGLRDLIEYQHKSFAAVIMEPREDSHAIQALCKKHNIVFILDEMITGFRYQWPSMGKHMKLDPDLSCFGKAMANGFSVACVGGKRKIMELGADRNMFLVSTTHGAELSGLCAFMATAQFMESYRVDRHLRDYRIELDKLLAPTLKIEKTLFMQEMCKNGVLIPWIAHSYRHQEKELQITANAIDASLDAIACGAKLIGPKVKAVFP